MGSLLFDGEQTVDQPAWVEPTVAQYEAALTDLTQHRSTTVAGGKLVSFERAEQLYYASRSVEPQLLRYIADGRAPTLADAVAFVRSIAPSWYPADKMLALMVLHAGGTYAMLVGKAPRQASAVVVGPEEIK